MSDQSPNQPGTPDPDDDAVSASPPADAASAPSADAPPPPPPAADPSPPPPPPAAPPPQAPATPPPPPPANTGGYPPPPPGAYPPQAPGTPAAYGGPPAPARPTLTIGDAFSYGWKGFTSNVGSVLLIVLVVVVVGLGLNVLAAVIDNGFLSFLVSLVAFVVGFVLALGVIRAALTITDGQRPSVGEVFQGDGVLQYILASIVLGAAFTVLNILGLITLVLFPVTLIITWVLAFFVQFFGYAILDEDTGAFNGISRSFDLVKSNFGELILLWLVALGINILGALLCGIGLLVTLPVTAIAWAFAWRRLTGGVVVPQQ